MTDLFDQDHLPPPGPPRIVRTRPRPGLLLVALVLVTVLGAGLLVGGGYVVTKVFGGGGTADYSGSGGAAVTVEVRHGDSAAAIGTSLATADVVKSARAFTDAAADDDRSATIQPGFYRLRKQMKARTALVLLLDPTSKIKSKVVIPEGFSLAKTLERIAAQTEIPLAELQAAAANPALLGLPPYAGTRVEGFLFPATYELGPGTTAVEALTQMTRRFAQAAVDVDLVARAAAARRTPYQIVVIASLLEREGKTAEEFGKISRVIANRLASGTALGLESTLRYALGADTDQARLLQSQIDKAKQSPYDTYVRKGLPPGPIGNPGQAALEAALDPTPGDWTYFVTLPKDNRTYFTTSAAEFNQLVARCQAEGGC
jgi:UPF0755 protein